MTEWVNAHRISWTAAVPILLVQLLLVACGVRSSNGPRTHEGSEAPAGVIVYLTGPLGPGPLSVKVHPLGDTGDDSVMRLTFDPAGTKFRWSPDGTHVAFVRDDRLFVAAAGGSDRRLLQEGIYSLAEPTWSPDGDRLAVLGMAGGFGAMQHPLIVDATTGDAWTIDGMKGLWNALDWSPDGSRIGLAGTRLDPPGTGIWVLSIDTASEVVQLAQGRSPRSVRWSPDGQRLLFFEFDTAIGDRTCADFGSVASSVWTVGVDGSEPKRLTDWEGVDGWPVWSPDGEWVAFASDRPVDWNPASDCRTAQRREVDIWVMRADGTDPRLVVLAGESFTAGPIYWRRTA